MKQDADKEATVQRVRDANSLKELRAKQAKYKQMFLDKLKKEKEEKKWNNKQYKLMHLNHLAKKNKQARHNKEDRILVNLKNKEVKATKLIYLL